MFVPFTLQVYLNEWTPLGLFYVNYVNKIESNV